MGEYSATAAVEENRQRYLYFIIPNDSASVVLHFVLQFQDDRTCQHDINVDENIIALVQDVVLYGQGLRKVKYEEHSTTIPTINKEIHHRRP